MATAESAPKRMEQVPMQTSTGRGVPSGPNPGKRTENPAQRSRPSRFSGVLDYFKREPQRAPDQADLYLKLSAENPDKAEPHLKLAEIYHRRGDEKEAIHRYLQASEIFLREHSIPEAMAVYKQVLSLNPHLVEVNVRMGEIYARMGMLEEAISQYRIAGKYYARFGRKEKVPEIASVLRELESRRRSREPKAEPASDSLKIPGARPETLSLSGSKKALVSASEKASPFEGDKERNDGTWFDLRAELSEDPVLESDSGKEVATDRFSGFEDIVKELRETEIPGDVYPDFHYQLGMACREMGFNDGAIEQLQIAFTNNQKPVESARLLSRCFREKGWFQEAQKYFEKAQQIESRAAQKRNAAFKGELVMVHS